MNGKKGLLWLFPFCETKGDARDISRHEDLEGRRQEGGSRGHGQQVNLIMWAQNVVASFGSKSNLWWILPFLRSSPDNFFACYLHHYSFLFYTVFGFVCLVPYILKPYPHATRHGRLTQDQTEKKSWVFFCIGLCWSTTTKGGIFHKRDIPHISKSKIILLTISSN